MRTLIEVMELYPPVPASEITPEDGWYYLLEDGSVVGRPTPYDERFNHAVIIDCDTVQAGGSTAVPKFCAQYNVLRLIVAGNVYIDVDRPLTQAQREALNTIFRTVGNPIMTWRTYPNGEPAEHEDGIIEFFRDMNTLRPGIDEWKVQV
jgi:hypothetical protein